ncbi:hypothetical protein ACHAPC_004670 [Botrytis cinerea]|nr:putative pectin lyase protein [Botrytis cinerea BcDW1]
MKSSTRLITFITLALSPLINAATTVSGSAYGFAKGVSGGGSAVAAAPSDIAQLKSWLADSTPRVILIDKTFNFVGSEGSATDTGCYQASCKPSNGGQDYIGTLSCTPGSNIVASTITYDKAGSTPLVVASSKTLLGVGSAGVIAGKGLRIPATSTNIIIQNIHFTNMNPAHVWGGDAISLEGSRGVWIDHCKFSLIGRQMIVSHYAASQFTISNCEFYGTTTTSATCNGNHYWTMMIDGPNDLLTLDRNYWHNLSGRAPKVSGTNAVVQITNNYMANNAGHDFELYDGTTVLVEGNVLENVTLPFSGTGGTVWNVPDSTSATTCASYLGRNCALNTVTNSGAAWPSLKVVAALTTFKQYGNNWLVTPVAASAVKSSVLANAGVGKI